MKIVLNSSSIVFMGIKSCIAWDKEIYSNSVVDKAISLYSLDVHRIQQPAKVIVYPVQECILMASVELSLVHDPANQHQRSS